MGDIAQFRREILALSDEKDNYNVAILEWNKPVPNHYPDGDGTCICGQTNITRMYILTHTTKKALVEIGCNCAARVCAELLAMQCKYCTKCLTYERQREGKEMCGICERRARTMGNKTLYTIKHKAYYTEYKTKNTLCIKYYSPALQRQYESGIGKASQFPFKDFASRMISNPVTFETIARVPSICELIMENYETGKYDHLEANEYNTIVDLLLYIEVYHFHPDPKT